MSALLADVLNVAQLSWQNDSACKGVDPEEFHPYTIAKAREAARTHCGECPVREKCFEYAVDERLNEGVWGGFWFKGGTEPPRFLLKIDLRTHLRDLHEQGFRYTDMAALIGVSKSAMLRYMNGELKNSSNRRRALTKHRLGILRRLTYRDIPDPFFTEGEELLAYLQGMFDRGFLWNDMADVAGIDRQLLFRFRRDGQKLRVSEAMKLQAVTIEQRPKVPLRMRRTPALVESIKKQKIARSAHRYDGIICKVCGANVCPIGNNASKKTTCGTQECVQRARGRHPERERVSVPS